ncbi:unnamed protein product, partial [Amoebophrya sp. A120]
KNIKLWPAPAGLGRGCINQRNRNAHRRRFLACERTRRAQMGPARRSGRPGRLPALAFLLRLPSETCEASTRGGAWLRFAPGVPAALIKLP